jgi:hypothetical protein
MYLNFNEIFKFIKGALSEDNGNPSSMRINSTYAIIGIITSIIFGFIWVVIFWHDLILGYLAISAGLVTTAFGWKNAQKKNEEKVGNTKKN